MTDTDEIVTMFSYARPMGSPTETAFIARFLTPLGFKADPYGNLWLGIPTPSGEPSSVLFSSHVDTVNKREGISELFLADSGMLQLSKDDILAGHTCLGADDTAGIWLMVNMIRHGVPGRYVIHHGEESGCIGSRCVAKLAPELLQGITKAIAFDRAGYGDVITHQCGMRTASEEFAEALSDRLWDAAVPDTTGLHFQPCDGGVYTDTNEYKDLVPECTNLSVGYFDQHTRDERQNVGFLIRLRDACLKVDWEGLPVVRDPLAAPEFIGRDWGRGSYAPGFGDDMEDLVADYPGIAADLMAAYGITYEDMQEEIARHTGRLAGRGWQ